MLLHWVRFFWVPGLTLAFHVTVEVAQDPRLKISTDVDVRYLGSFAFSSKPEEELQLPPEEGKSPFKSEFLKNFVVNPSEKTFTGGVLKVAATGRLQLLRPGIVNAVLTSGPWATTGPDAQLLVFRADQTEWLKFLRSKDKSSSEANDSETDASVSWADLAANPARYFLRWIRCTETKAHAGLVLPLRLGPADESSLYLVGGGGAKAKNRSLGLKKKVEKVVDETTVSARLGFVQKPDSAERFHFVLLLCGVRIVSEKLSISLEASNLQNGWQQSLSAEKVGLPQLYALALLAHFILLLLWLRYSTTTTTTTQNLPPDQNLNLMQSSRALLPLLPLFLSFFSAALISVALNFECNSARGKDSTFSVSLLETGSALCSVAARTAQWLALFVLAGGNSKQLRSPLSFLFVLQLFSLLGGAGKDFNFSPQISSSHNLSAFSHVSTVPGLLLWTLFFVLFLQLLSLAAHSHAILSWNAEQTKWSVQFVFLASLWFAFCYLLPLGLSVLLPASEEEELAASSLYIRTLFEVIVGDLGGISIVLLLYESHTRSFLISANQLVTEPVPRSLQMAPFQRPEYAPPEGVPAAMPTPRGSPRKTRKNYEAIGAELESDSATAVEGRV